MENKTFRKIGWLFLVILFAACQQNKKHNNYRRSDRLKMSIQLVDYFRAFEEDAHYNNVNVDAIYSLQNISFAESNNLQGETSMELDRNAAFYGYIQINENLIEDSIGLRFVLYHELGHWLGLDHSDGIMTKAYNSESDSAYVKENWDILCKDYFDKLKRQTNEIDQSYVKE